MNFSVNMLYIYNLQFLIEIFCLYFAEETKVRFIRCLLKWISIKTQSNEVMLVF